MMKWLYYPSTQPLPIFGQKIFGVFEEVSADISSENASTLQSNDILRLVRPGLENIGFSVERGKKKHQLVKVPVLFGENGRIRKSFDADGYHLTEKWVIEVEAGRAVINNQFLKDIFQACMMNEAIALALAVRIDYKGRDDFNQIKLFLDTLFASNRMTLPLDGILLIGY